MADQQKSQEQSEPHPLQFKWTLWHDVGFKSKSGTYGSNLRNVASFDTVEDFWALFNNLKEPTQLQPGQTYNLFKHGIEPKWEDPVNQEGGEWRVMIPSSRNTVIDGYWINTILTVIGEGFRPDESDDIAGIVVNRRKAGDRIAIWTKEALNEELQQNIGRRWRETTNISMRMDFLAFKDLLGTKTGRPKPRYVIN